jgi:hypothetical protein
MKNVAVASIPPGLLPCHGLWLWVCWWWNGTFSPTRLLLWCPGNMNIHYPWSPNQQAVGTQCTVTLPANSSRYIWRGSQSAGTVELHTTTWLSETATQSALDYTITRILSMVYQVSFFLKIKLFKNLIFCKICMYLLQKTLKILSFYSIVYVRP